MKIITFFSLKLNAYFIAYKMQTVRARFFLFFLFITWTTLKTVITSTRSHFNRRMSHLFGTHTIEGNRWFQKPSTRFNSDYSSGIIFFTSSI